MVTDQNHQSSGRNEGPATACQARSRLVIPRAPCSPVCNSRKDLMIDFDRLFANKFRFRFSFNVPANFHIQEPEATTKIYFETSTASILNMYNGTNSPSHTRDCTELILKLIAVTDRATLLTNKAAKPDLLI
jgi:hypothetical protein